MECFAQAKSAGFDAVELAIGADIPLDITRDAARRMGDDAAKAGVRIATIWVSGPRTRIRSMRRMPPCARAEWRLFGRQLPSPPI